MYMYPHVQTDILKILSTIKAQCLWIVILGHTEAPHNFLVCLFCTLSQMHPVCFLQSEAFPRSTFCRSLMFSAPFHRARWPLPWSFLSSRHTNLHICRCCHSDYTAPPWGGNAGSRLRLKGGCERRTVQCQFYAFTSLCLSQLHASCYPLLSASPPVLFSLRNIQTEHFLQWQHPTNPQPFIYLFFPSHHFSHTPSNNLENPINHIWATSGIRTRQRHQITTKPTSPTSNKCLSALTPHAWWQGNR